MVTIDPDTVEDPVIRPCASLKVVLPGEDAEALPEIFPVASL